MAGNSNRKVENMNPLNESQMSRLQDSVSWSIKQLRFPRAKRVSAVKHFAGYHYAEDGAAKREAIPMLAMAVSIYVRQLVSRAPRVLITTKQTDLKPFAADLELAINQIPEEIDLSATLQRLVTEALFSFGVVKCGLHTVDTVNEQPYGKTFVDTVTLDDYFCDMGAKRMDLIDYEGNDYWIDYKEVMEGNWARKKSLIDLKPDESTDIGPEGEARADTMQTGETEVRFKDKLWMRDVWLPDDNLLVTYGVKNERVFNVVEWEGPDDGPYHKLGFTDVPGCLLPLPPVSLWRDLHELANTLFRKLKAQGEGAKDVLGFPGGSPEDVEAFKTADDRGGILYTGAEPKTLTVPGPDPTTMAFFLQCRDLGSYFAGNLDSLGGLAPQTETVGQDKLLGAAAGAQLADMATKTVGAIRGIFKAITFYEWNDPIKSRTLEKPIPGTDMTIPIEWNKDSKQGDFDLYDLDIDVYSLQDDSPGLKLQKLGMVMEQYILPLMPLIQQAGGTVDAQTILRLVARYADLPEIDEIVTFAEPPINVPSGAPTGKPANTTRTYDRVTGGGQTREGASANLQQILMGGNAQGGQTEKK